MIVNHEDYPVHDSMRGWFGRELYFQMQDDPSVMCFTGDLGYGLLDKIKEDFPDRFLNFGAAEQCMIGAAVGATLAGRIVFCYSITTFLLYRAFEWHRNYLHHESVPVLLVGSGLDHDYKHDGFTHHSFDAKEILKHLWRIDTYYPPDKEAIPGVVERMIANRKPAYLCLRR